MKSSFEKEFYFALVVTLSILVVSLIYAQNVEAGLNQKIVGEYLLQGSLNGYDFVTK